MLGTTLAALALAALFAERRRQEATIVASEARLRSILGAANVIAWDVDLIRNTVDTTGPVGRLLDRPGPEPHDFAGFVESIHPKDRDRVMAQFWTAVSTNTVYELEFRLRSSSGNARWVTAEGPIERDSSWPACASARHHTRRHGAQASGARAAGERAQIARATWCLASCYPHDGHSRSHHVLQQGSC